MVAVDRSPNIYTQDVGLYIETHYSFLSLPQMGIAQ
jgi:hypothetical protein